VTPDLDAFGNPVGPSDAGRLAAPTAPGLAPPPPPAPRQFAGATTPGAPTSSAATAALVLGIFGMLVWFVAPFAWSRANRALAEIDASMGRLGGRGSARAARMLGIIGTVLFGLTVLFGIIGAVDPHH
jgi:hypothetical protein